MAKRTKMLFMVALGIGLAWSAPVAAKPSAESQDDRPWGKGLLVPSFGLGGSFSGGAGSLFAGALSFGGGASYFVANGVAVGLSFNNDIRFFSQSARDDFPGVEDNLPTYSGRLTPQVTFVPFRSRRFSPYLRGGLGPVFLNNGGGVLAEWSVAVGGWVGIGKRAALDIGLGASQSFPGSRCDDSWSFTASNGNVVDGRANCGLFFYPQIGIVFAIQASPKRGRKSKKKAPEERAQPSATTETDTFAAPVVPVASPQAPTQEPPTEFTAEPEPEPETELETEPETKPETKPETEPETEPATEANEVGEPAVIAEPANDNETEDSGEEQSQPVAAKPATVGQ